MERSTRDVPGLGAATGLVFALISAASFGMSGTLGRGLMDLGWSAGSATLARVAIAGVILSVPGALAMRGKWSLLRSAWPVIVAYGIFAVACPQFFYFLAVTRLDVSVALLIEYTSPIAVVLWMWLRHGSRPGPLTFAGAGFAIVGLMFLLDVLGGGGGVDPVGLFWGLLAMTGGAAYFVLSGKPDTGLPPVCLAAGGLLVAAVALGLFSAIGIVPAAFATGTVQFLPFAMPWWVAVLLLGVVAAALAYVSGIIAARLLGSRLASFVALFEVVLAAVFAWILLGQALGPAQFVGAALVLVGVILVKLGEGSGVTRRVRRPNPERSDEVSVIAAASAQDERIQPAPSAPAAS